MADGFTYLQDAKWSRGPYNKFIVDLLSLEFVLIQDFDIVNGIMRLYIIIMIEKFGLQHY